jgi:hypothetical protein
MTYPRSLLAAFSPMADLYSSIEQPAQGKGSPCSHKRHTSAEGGYTPISCCRLLYTFELERRRGKGERAAIG